MSATVTATPTVLVVLVAHDGAVWLPRTLDALLDQDHRDVTIIAVDNASQDGSRELLLDRLGEQRVLVADRDLGFGAAVSMALDAGVASDAPYVLTLHDDCALGPGALRTLVAAMEADPRLAITGPKLRQWDSPERLESAGWTIDLTGRADNGVDPDELDQGQHDQDRRALYVPTTAMLLRREVLEAVGRFDRRFHVFRDDLDLCWRMWLGGHEVEVVPEAVADHAAGASNYLRLGQTRFIGPRYFAERNTLATLIKNYAGPRLALVIPLYLLVGLAKVVGFVLTRRFSDAYQTLRAWVWNLVHLRETRRLRRQVQRGRVRSDAELAALFGRIGPRVRAYGEAMATWVAGGDTGPTPAPSEEQPRDPRLRSSLRVRALLRQRPVLVVGGLLVILLLAGTWPILLPGELRGGELAPWPASAGTFLGDYVAGWHEAGAVGTSAPPSPAQVLLGLFQGLLGNSAYAASRGVLLVPFIAAWLLALRAAQVYSRRRLPRVVAASAYVLSPPALAALVTGRVGALVTLAVLPGLVAGGTTLARRRSTPARAWRAVAGVALLGGVGGAFEPLLLVAIVVVGAVATFIGLLVAKEASWRIALATRAGAAVLGPVVLLAPWSLRVFAPDGPLAGSAQAAAGDELWRWLLLAPSLPGFPGLLAGGGFLLAGVLGLVLGARRSLGLASALWAVALAGAIGGWWLDRSLAVTWAGLPLLATAAAFAGLLAFAFATGEAQLARHAFGWRQVAVAATATMVAASFGVVATSLVGNDWDRFRVGDPSLPSFVVAAAEESGPFRVLTLADRDGEVVYELVDGRGPSMANYGVTAPAAADDLVADVVEDLLSGRDPGASDRLARFGVRYVLVPAGGASEPLDAALLDQVGLDPRPVPEGRLLAVAGSLPYAAAVATVAGPASSNTGAVPDPAAVRALRQVDNGVYVGRLDAPGSLFIAEVDDGAWRLQVDRSDEGTLARGSGSGELVVFDDVPAGTVTVTHEGTAARGLAVTGQLLAVLLAVSLALRPPTFARRHPGEPEPVGGPTMQEAAS